MLEETLRRLYGDERAAEALPRVRELIERWREPITTVLGPSGNHSPACPAFTEQDAVLIAYGDHIRSEGEAPLATLAAWCRSHLKGLLSVVHVLPFHPSTSYEGYAITDYTAVDPALGTWADLAEMHQDFDLMIDLVLNHCSASHPWFQQFLADEEPGRRYFVTMDDPEAPWLDEVGRARDVPLLHAFETRAGCRHVWTTYSPDLIDLDWKEPAVCLEFLEILLDAVVRGARLVRLDAFVYTWKEAGTPCVARPETHVLLRLFQQVLKEVGASEVAILPSITNVTQSENFTYFGPDHSGREADLIYHLPLSALLLLTLYREDAKALSRWLKDLPPAPPGRAYLNLAATHDGIGLTWLKDLLPEEGIRDLIQQAAARGALLSSRRPTATGEDMPWEINATWWSACTPLEGSAPGGHLSGFLATQSVVLALRGIPALYFSLFMAGANDHGRLARTGDNRAVNRGRFDLAAWERAMSTEGSVEAAVLAGLQALLRARRACKAFHPEGAQRVLSLGVRAVLGLERTPPGRDPGGIGSVLCLTNFSSQPVRIAAEELLAARNGVRPGDRWRDLLSGEADAWELDLELAPFQVRWLVGGAA